MAVPIPHRLFTVDEYYRMAEVGILKPNERVELLAGEIVPMNPIGSPHAWCVNRLVGIFAPRSGEIRLGVQNPIRLDDRSEPEPDLVVLRPETSTDSHPRPADVLLVVEVADSSLAYDRGVKAPLYALEGIPELWIADLGGERVEVYREPSPSGYRLVQVFGRGQGMSPLFAPDLTIEVDAIFGSA